MEDFRFTPENAENKGHDIPQQTPNQVIDHVVALSSEHPQQGSMLAHVAQKFTTLRANHPDPEAWRVRSVLERSFENTQSGSGWYLEPHPRYDTNEERQDRQRLSDTERATIEETLADLQRLGFQIERNEVEICRSNGILGDGQVAAQVGGFGEVGHEKVYVMPIEPHQYATVTIDTRDNGDEYLFYTGIPEKAKSPNKPHRPDSHLFTYIYLPGTYVPKPFSTLRDA